MSPNLIVVILALLLGLQPITTDLYLPALPALTLALGASLSQAQLTLTALLLAFGSSQLVWGPLSDRYGRRPILLLGLGLYVVAALGCAAAGSIGWLIAWRALQGAALGAAVMCARAIVRDLYAPADGARVMSKGLSGLGLIAIASAVSGSLLAGALGWRSALLALAVFGAVTLAVIALRFQESLLQPNPNALQLRTLLGTWLQILRHPTFRAFCALSCASYAGLFTFLAASSFVYIRVLHWPTLTYGVAMLTTAAAYLAGTFLCRHWLARYGVQRTVGLAGVLSLLGGGGMLLVYAFGWHLQHWGGMDGGWLLLLPFYAFMVGHGIHQPCSQSGAVGPFPQAAGAASALNGFLMMGLAFAVGGWLGLRLDSAQGDGIWPLPIGIAFWSVCIAVIAWTLVRRLALQPATTAPTAPAALAPAAAAGLPG